jgi:hypothetical protein
VIGWLFDIVAPPALQHVALSYRLGRTLGLTRRQALRAAWRSARGS